MGGEQETDTDTDVATAVDEAARTPEQIAAESQEAESAVRGALGFKAEPVDPEDEGSYEREAAVEDEAADDDDARSGTPTDDLDTRLMRLVERMEQQQATGNVPAAVLADDDADDADDAFGDGKLGKTVKQLRAQVAQQTTAMKVFSQLLEAQTVGYNKSGLAAKYPQLKTAGAMEKVVRRAGALLQTGEYSGLDEAFDDAAKLVFGFEGGKESVNEKQGVERLNKLKRQGSPTGKGAVDREKSVEEKWRKLGNVQKGDIILRLIQEGRREEAQRLKALG